MLQIVVFIDLKIEFFTRMISWFSSRRTEVLGSKHWFFHSSDWCCWIRTPDFWFTDWFWLLSYGNSYKSLLHQCVPYNTSSSLFMTLLLVSTKTPTFGFLAVLFYKYRLIRVKNWSLSNDIQLIIRADTSMYQSWQFSDNIIS